MTVSQKARPSAAATAATRNSSDETSDTDDDDASNESNTSDDDDDDSVVVTADLSPPTLDKPRDDTPQQVTARRLLVVHSLCVQLCTGLR